ncbi:DUF1833 domain containing protein [Vibrio phage pVco-14]|nr:DUF1833 domain containing protein [Vibrio phage pVco-14]
MSNLSEALRESYAIGGGAAEYYETLEIYHPNLKQSIFIVKAMHPIRATLEDGRVVDFMPVGFKVKLPSASTYGNVNLDFVVDNTEGVAMSYINDTARSRTPPEITYRPYLKSDLSVPQMVPPLRMFAKTPRVTEQAIFIRASFFDLTNKDFPNEFYNRQRFPGIG